MALFCWNAPEAQDPFAKWWKAIYLTNKSYMLPVIGNRNRLYLQSSEVDFKFSLN